MSDSTRSDHFNREVIQTQATSSGDWSNGEDADDLAEIIQLKNRRQAQREYGLNLYQIRMAVKRGQLQRVQLGGEGRIYYLENQLRELAARLQNPAFTFAGAA